jgi:uncharacterized protein (DUF1697 family)
MQTHIALLRGINVGGKNMLPMKQLAAFFGELGAGNARTYIQSGNVVFELPSDVAVRELGQRMEGLIKEQFGVTTPIVLRTAQELTVVLSGNPFMEQGVSEGELFVMFLKDEPTAEAIAGLDPLRSPVDQFIVQGREVYLSLRSAASTKLTNAYFDSRLKTIGTSRNWRTVKTLCEMAK